MDLVEIDNVNRREFDFESLPKNLKEEIWGYLSVEDYFRNRRVCKDWENKMESPSSNSLKNIYEIGRSQVIIKYPFLESSEDESKHILRHLIPTFVIHPEMPCGRPDNYTSAIDAICLPCRKRNGEKLHVAFFFVYPFLVFAALILIFFKLLSEISLIITFPICFLKRARVCGFSFKRREIQLDDLQTFEEEIRMGDKKTSTQQLIDVFDKYPVQKAPCSLVCHMCCFTENDFKTNDFIPSDD